MADWYTVDPDDDEGTALERLTAAWSDAPTENLETLGLLVEVARDQVWAYAPESEDDAGADVPIPATGLRAGLVLAQLSQIRNLWNAGRAGSDGDIGDGGFTFTPRPLDKTIKGMIRPTRGPNAC